MSEGVAAESAVVWEHTDCISHIPKQHSDTLADWQRIAEFYVERPRIVMCGRAVRNICYNLLQVTFIYSSCLFKTKPLRILSPLSASEMVSKQMEMFIVPI